MSERIVVIDPNEAEKLISQFKLFNFEEYGTPEWLRQHEGLEKCNLQAHHNAKSQSDPYIMELFLTYDKSQILVWELLMAEAFRGKIFPNLGEDIKTEESLLIYYMLYHEAVIMNILEVFIFSDRFCSSLDDVLVEIIDYSVRRLLDLNKYQYGDSDGQQLIMKQKADIEFSSAISSITTLRYIASYANILSVPIQSRLMKTHDIPILLISFIENPPWTRRDNKGKWYKFYDNKWNEVHPKDLLVLTPIEGQVWLIYISLLCSESTSKLYIINQYRKENLLRLQKYLHNILIDQINELNYLLKFLTQLSLLNLQNTSITSNHINDPSTSSLILEVVPDMTNLIYKSDFEKLTKFFIDNIFIKNDELSSILKEMANFYVSDEYEQIAEINKCSNCGKTSSQKCGRCKSEYYCSRECQKSHWDQHKSICDKLSQLNSK